MSEPRVIKRYANRKLYDTQSSQYVTLDQIAQMIRAGEEVRVLDNNSKDDLTSVTLAQIIFEEEKRQKSFIPLGAMRHLIQSGGASLQELAQQAQARVLSVFRKGENDELRPEQQHDADVHRGTGGADARIGQPAMDEQCQPDEADRAEHAAGDHGEELFLLDRDEQRIDLMRRQQPYHMAHHEQQDANVEQVRSPAELLGAQHLA